MHNKRNQQGARKGGQRPLFMWGDIVAGTAGAVADFKVENAVPAASLISNTLNTEKANEFNPERVAVLCISFFSPLVSGRPMAMD